MSGPSLVCRSLDDDAYTLRRRNSSSIKTTCRHSTGSQQPRVNDCCCCCFLTDNTSASVCLTSRSRVSVDTVSSLGDGCHDAVRLSRRSLVRGREYVDIQYHHESSEIDVAYSNVAAILAMDGGSVQSYPSCWMTTNVSDKEHDRDDTRVVSDDNDNNTTTNDDAMKSSNAHHQDSIAMLQNALETVMNSQSSSFFYSS